jgi:hypothetical protein
MPLRPTTDSGGARFDGQGQGRPAEKEVIASSTWSLASTKQRRWGMPQGKPGTGELDTGLGHRVLPSGGGAARIFASGVAETATWFAMNGKRCLSIYSPGAVPFRARLAPEWLLCGDLRAWGAVASDCRP